MRSAAFSYANMKGRDIMVDLGVDGMIGTDVHI
jgi:hypothetical protein